MLKRHLLSILLVAAVPLAAGRVSQVHAADAPKLSVTVYPVGVVPQSFDAEMARRVGIVVATLLERAGVEDLAMAENAFSAPETDEVRQIAEAFGRHVAEKPISTDYAVFAQFLGTPASGVAGIRTIVVDRAGKVVLAEAAGKEELDRAALRPKDPMTCCIFVGRRLQEFWKLQDPLRPDAPQGKMARFWQEDAGIPPQEELDAIARRTETLKANIRTARCTLYAIRVGTQTDRQCAIELAAGLTEAGLEKVQVSETDPALKIAAHRNEQKVLWDTARAFREFIQKNPPATDYAVYADYGVFDGNVHHVHLVICDRAGQWVLLDMQNSHHPDFERIDPKTPSDCNRLVLARLKAWVGEK